MSDVDTRLAKLENSFDIINRLEEKIDKIAELTAKLATIEEKHHYQSNAIDRAFVAIEKNAIQIESLREALSNHDKFSASAIANIKEQTFDKIDTHFDDFETKYDNMHTKVESLENDIISKVSWAKGAWFAASILWVIIQIGVIWALKSTTDVISETKEAVVELRIDNNANKQNYKSIDKRLTIQENLKSSVSDNKR